MFSEKLKKIMKEKNLSQTELSNAIGIGKSSISQYLSNKHIPSNPRKKEIARLLNLDENYFNDFVYSESKIDDVESFTVKDIAKLMKKSIKFVEKGLQDGVFPFGYAVKLKKWSYYISPIKFQEYTGINLCKKEEQYEQQESGQ